MTTVATTPVERLLSSPLAAAGGVAVVPGLPDPATLRRMAAEALDAGRRVERQHSISVIGDDGRGATPGRALANEAGGPVQDRFYASADLRRFLSAQCATTIRPTSGRGTYSFYTRPGDFLDLHVDVVTCDVTVITVLQDSTPSNDPGGAVAVYGHHVGVPLSRVRAEAASPTAVIKAPAGHSIVLLGGLIPHQVLPLGPRGTRVISALCFEAS